MIPHVLYQWRQKRKALYEAMRSGRKVKRASLYGWKRKSMGFRAWVMRRKKYKMA